MGKLAPAVTSIFLLSGCADLIVTAVDDVPFLTTNRMLRSTVKNDGWWSAPASHTKLEVKMPTSSSFAQMANTPTPALGRGEQAELQMWPFNVSTLVAAGQCIEVRVCADSDSSVNEGWFGGEGNNCTTRSFCRN